MATRPNSGTLFGHPKGLFVLFFTEMWERFSYYGMRALLMLYMTNYFLWAQEDASRVYKWYTSLVYFTPLLGGYLADRWLGNRKAVIIGAILMAIGHFLMAFEDYPIFFTALVFLIMGNGFFKPNMSVQVGRLYTEDDPRRDGAYTIFYMGINLGAFFSPLVCSTLGEKIGYHWGFSAAGVGMVIGLLIYLLGQRWVLEIAQPAEKPVGAKGEAAGLARDADRSAFPALSNLTPLFFMLIAAFAVVGGPVAWWFNLHPLMDRDNAIFSILIGVAMAIIAFILMNTSGKARDRVLAISALMIFVVVFWMAFEQAGNVLNVWADKHTDRYVFHHGESPLPETALPAATQPMPAPGDGMAGWEMPAGWFQSVNPLLIVLLAPLFAAMWVWMSRRGWEPSTPAKMSIGVFMVGMSFVAMVGAAREADKPSQAPLPAVPATIQIDDKGRLSYDHDSGHKEAYLGGKLVYEAGTKTLQMRGILPDLERDRILAESAPPDYKKIIQDLVKRSQEAGKAAKEAKQEKFSVTADLPSVPPGFDLRWAGGGAETDISKTTLGKVSYDEAIHRLTATAELNDRDEKRLLQAGADADFRTAMWQIYRQTWPYRASTIWLFVSFLLATMGELCLSPVGLSMVSKLAPAKFATLLMGMWLCTSFFAGFLAGFMGELWGRIAPIPFFWIFVAVSVVLAGVLVVLVKPIRKLMHGAH